MAGAGGAVNEGVGVSVPTSTSAYSHGYTRVEKRDTLRMASRPSPVGDGRPCRPYRMLTARETIRPIVSSETTDWTPMITLAIGVSGIVSVGENAVLLVSDTYR
jgi:hypothetical protein